MLRPEEIRNKRFEKGSFGYKADEVDAFMTRVADDYETLFNNNIDSEEKIIKLVEKINEYREDEDAIKLALLSAQKESKRIIAEANAECERMIAEASAKREQVERQSEIECERIIAENKEYCAKVISENTLETERKIAEVKNEYEYQSERLREIKLATAQFKAQLTEIYSQQIQLVMQMPDDDGEPEVRETQEEAVAEETPVAEPAPIIAEEPSPVISEETASVDAPAEETSAVQPADVPALKDESVFADHASREVKFSDLRFGNKN